MNLNKYVFFPARAVSELEARTTSSSISKPRGNKLQSITSHNVREVANGESKDDEDIPLSAKPVLWQKIPIVKLKRSPSIENLVSKQNDDKKMGTNRPEGDVQNKIETGSNKPTCKVPLGEEMDLRIPFYFGCEYRCLDCGRLFFYIAVNIQ